MGINTTSSVGHALLKAGLRVFILAFPVLAHSTNGTLHAFE